MAKYQRKPVVVDAELFKPGMGDGYACYELDGRFIGHYERDGALPRVNRKPAIKTLEGWYEVKEGEHFIVTGIKGERYPVETEIFHKLYDLVEGEKERVAFSTTHLMTDNLATLHENERVLNKEYIAELLKGKRLNHEN